MIVYPDDDRVILLCNERIEFSEALYEETKRVQEAIEKCTTKVLRKHI